MRKLVLIAALGSLLGACSVAETTHQADAGLMPRDPPYAKGDASNDTFHQQGQASAAYASNSAPIPPRDPPYAKGDASNDTFHVPGQAPAAYASNSAPIPPRDPPYAKGDASNDTFHVPGGM